ncbi:MAG: LON peptidase substrate-binding domain-containing protein, partial [Chloroflexus sp.]
MNDETLREQTTAESEETSPTTPSPEPEVVETLPLIPLEGAVVFPYIVVSLTLDELGSASAEAAAREGRQVLLAARRPDAPADAPITDQLFNVGVVARIEQ